MAYSFPRGETILLAWQVLAGDPTLLSAATAALRPALAVDPSRVDPAQAKVADFTVALQAADTGGAWPAFWLLTLSATACAAVALGNYLVDLRLTFADGTVQTTNPVQLTITEPATTA